MRRTLLAVLALVLAGCGHSAAPTERAQPAAERAVVVAFWRDLRAGNAEAAFALLAPAEQQRLGGARAWRAGYAADPVRSFTLQLDAVTATRVGVTALRVVRAASGCRDLAGRYLVVRRGRRWLIGYAELGASPCK